MSCADDAHMTVPPLWKIKVVDAELHRPDTGTSPYPDLGAREPVRSSPAPVARTET